MSNKITLKIRVTNIQNHMRMQTSIGRSRRILDKSDWKIVADDVDDFVGMGIRDSV